MIAYPSDPFVLLSVVNTRLRDFYVSLSDLCEDSGESEREIRDILSGIGYFYSEERNQFLKN